MTSWLRLVMVTLYANMKRPSLGTLASATSCMCVCGGGGRGGQVRRKIERARARVVEREQEQELLSKTICSTAIK